MCWNMAALFCNKHDALSSRNCSNVITLSELGPVTPRRGRLVTARRRIRCKKGGASFSSSALGWLCSFSYSTGTDLRAEGFVAGQDLLR